MSLAPFYEPQRAWMRNAACKGHEPEAWFPRAGGKPDPKVLAVCDRCPVKDACRDYAIDTHADHGIWGGLSPEQRKRIVWQRMGAA